ncbi:hypothetical protein SAMN05421543_1513 [Alicyclobacillus macrosporangiidus]|uniref:Uncharacterized protein n=1 Tax=Alicyclobacillus macrosporangiidus TaxID=392015 RepID=A0A1I7LHF4_9BACL|nr:hypothetical protein SAMN05421543_1513 [Alicyclobacillus macrosporangiidus]
MWKYLRRFTIRELYEFLLYNLVIVVLVWFTGALLALFGHPLAFRICLYMILALLVIFAFIVDVLYSRVKDTTGIGITGMLLILVGVGTVGYAIFHSMHLIGV